MHVPVLGEQETLELQTSLYSVQKRIGFSGVEHQIREPETHIIWIMEAPSGVIESISI